MERRNQLRLDALERVRSFLEVNAAKVGPLLATEAGRDLNAAIEAVTARSIEQGAAQRELDGAHNEARRMEQDLKKYLLTPLAKFARAKLADNPKFKELHSVPYNLQGRRLAAAARAMASAARPHAKALAAAQWSDDGAQSVEVAAAALDRVLDSCEAARSRRVIATAAIPDRLARGRDAVDMLDAVLTKRLAGKPDLVAAWRITKRVAHAPVASASRGD